MVSTTLLTITGDRHIAFRQCEEYMRRQTFQDFEWVVIDDGITPTEVTMGQQYIRASPQDDPRESFRSNMSTALQAAQSYNVAFIEDDDWYSRWHLESVLAPLGRGRTRGCGREGLVQLSGQCKAKYYNIRERCWKVHTGEQHASLCQTAICGDAMKQLARSTVEAADKPECLDGTLWKSGKLLPETKHLHPCSTTTVGIKGMVGRSGLGIDHGDRKTLFSKGYHDDRDLKQLELWIGDDVNFYKELSYE